MKLLSLRRSKSQSHPQEDSVFQGNKDHEEEFEVIPSTSSTPYPGNHDSLHLVDQPTELKKQNRSLLRGRMLGNKDHYTYDTCATGATTANESNQPFSPASTAASSTDMTPVSNKKQPKFIHRLQKKTSDLFNFDGPTERISVGDEYAIISVKPKSLSWDANVKDTTTPTAAAVPMTQETTNIPLKKQRFSLVRMFSTSRSDKAKRNHGDVNQLAMQHKQPSVIPKTRSSPTFVTSYNDGHEPNELKKQRFSLVRPFSSRRN
mmetsp:Transcript_363/g.609  ORF Transcript_363/g.609 Transcript_363/m.609 type:complete len:262 (-) Transcript_363:225-1010(-)|eukprot:CAMPEP_0176491840 /NCGR_PEP_ID=MMETSP0200_2-20121128/8650_1 /TAXON_ID=947934 /ORGANISM="Chaetoceros sp., Strain GSL56" /LENGTH=261 /DNA_ID=CAMNT_0017889303 /DNA_START=497 /DNA_END=1282 /DNA_ORIENTATION=-